MSVFIMNQQENEHRLIFSYLRSLNFHFLDTWVIECVNYYKSNYPNISLENLKNEVKQQWLLVNLREIKVPSLPPDLKSKEKIILEGTYAVQVESMIDSSKSCYSQLKKLLKVDIENIEATKTPEEHEVKSHRCLTFVISDGVQEIQAMEYQPIKKIKTDDPELLPGFKMVISGPVECRKGMILLKDENVRICGGEVDTLTVTNKLKNIIIKRLGFDESDYPENASLDNKDDNKQTERIIEDEFGDDCVKSLLSQNDDLLLSIPLETEILAQRPAECMKGTQNSKTEKSLYEDVIHKEDSLTERVRNKKHSLPQEELQMPVQKRPSLDPELTNEDSVLQNSLLNDDIFVDDDFYEQQSTPSTTLSKTTKPVQTKLSSFFKNSNVNDNQLTTNLYVSHKPFVYLKHIMSNKLNKPTIFTVKAVILTLKKKITIEKDEFNLKVNITDGSFCLDVDICSKILEDFLGFSPCEMIVMLKAKQTNSAIAQRIKESFSKAQEKLINLNSFIKIKFFADDRCPLILSLDEVTERHLSELKERS